MKYDLVIYDLDGTAFDTAPGIIHCVKEILTGIDHPIPDEKTIRSFIGPPLFEGFHEVCGVPRDAALQASQDYMALYRQVGYQMAEPYSGFRELLAAVVDVGGANAVATLKDQSYLLHMMEHYNLRQYFKAVCGSDDSKGVHTKGDVIRVCLGQTGYDPSRCVMIGDSAYDAEGAEECGMDFIAVTYGFGFTTREKAEAVKSVFVADTVEEIGEFLEVHKPLAVRG